MSRSTLILGGARSGKSRRALQLAQDSAAEYFFLIATAEARDEEMAVRIAAHRNERAPKWRTIEEPLQLSEAIGRVPHLVADPETGGDKAHSIPAVIVIDCLTLWLSNLMHADVNPDEAAAELIAAMKASPSEIILISNEVGLGLVPETALGRDFRDAQGRLNQAVAEAANIVEFVAAGLPMRLKP